MKIDIHHQIGLLLLDLQAELAQLQQWATETPDKKALSSDQPFCIDTLTFTQWLQFIFIKKMGMLVKSKSTLPEKCAIKPIAEEYFQREKLNGTRIIYLLDQIDQLLSQSDQGKSELPNTQRLN